MVSVKCLGGAKGGHHHQGTPSQATQPPTVSEAASALRGEALPIVRSERLDRSMPAICASRIVTENRATPLCVP